MASTNLIKVMISSRCNDEIHYRGALAKLSAVRQALKQAIETQTVFGRATFACWINEDAPPAAGTADSWDHCLEQVRKADIVIVLYNANAGWSKSSTDIGICHAELLEALRTGAAKVRLIELPLAPPPKNAAEKSRCTRFQKYVAEQSLFRGAVSDGEGVLAVATAALAEAVVDMTHLGVREARKGKYDTGQALEWSRLPFDRRAMAIEETLVDSLGGAPRPDRFKVTELELDGQLVLVRCHAIADSLGVAAAREAIGRPFLHDHALLPEMKSSAGPLHVVGCHKTITERQATSLLGFPDVVTVKTSFGVYVADRVHMAQVAFLGNCRDETSTRHAVQRFLVWLEASGEAHHVAARAVSRRKIVVAIGKEQP